MRRPWRLRRPNYRRLGIEAAIYAQVIGPNPYRRIGEPGSAERARWIATAPAEDLVLWQPGQESWSPEQVRAEGERIRTVALAAMRSVQS